MSNYYRDQDLIYLLSRPLLCLSIASLILVVKLENANGSECIELHRNSPIQVDLQYLLDTNQMAALEAYRAEDDAQIGKKIFSYVELITLGTASSETDGKLYLSKNTPLTGTVLNKHLYYLHTLDVKDKNNTKLFNTNLKKILDIKNKYCIFSEYEAFFNLLNLKYYGLQERTIYVSAEIVHALRTIFLKLNDDEILDVYLANIEASKNFVLSREISFWESFTAYEGKICKSQNSNKCLSELREFLLKTAQSSDVLDNRLPSTDYLLNFLCNITIIHNDSLIELNKCK